MQYLRQYLPFVAAVFFVPGISAGSRLFAFLILAALGGWVCFEKYRENTDPVLRFNLLKAPFLFLLWITVFFAGQSVADPWLYKVLFPSLLAGAMLVTYLSVVAVPLFEALGVVACMTWLILWVSSLSPQWLPLDFLNSQLPSLVPTGGAALSAFIEPPALDLREALFFMALNAATAFFITLFFLPLCRTNLLYSYLSALLLLVWMAVWVHIAGNTAYALLALHFAAFFFLYLLPNGQVGLRNAGYWAGFFAGLLLGALGWLSPVTLLISKVFSLFPLIEPPVVSQPLFSLDVVVPVGLDSGHGWAVVALVVLVGYLAARWDVFRRCDPACAGFFALGLSNLFLLDSSPLLWLSHPMTWLAFAAVTFPVDEEAQPEWSFLSVQFPQPYWRYARFAPVVIVGFLALVSVKQTYIEWRVESSMKSLFAENDLSGRLSRAEMLYRSYGYRGDATAVYASLTAEDAYRRNDPPDETRLLELEVAAHKGMKYGYLPLAAVQRISDFYFLHGMSQRSLAVFSQTMQQYPQAASLREPYGDRLLSLGRNAEALAEFRKCINEAPSNYRLYEKLARCLKALEQTEEYDQVIATIKALNPASDME